MTVGEIWTEVFENFKETMGNHWNDEAEPNWSHWKLSFSETMDSDAPPWLGTDHTGRSDTVPD